MNNGKALHMKANIHNVIWKTLRHFTWRPTYIIEHI